MGYHENTNSIYPDSINCNNEQIFDATDFGGYNYVGQKVRHHRIPDCMLKVVGDIANTEWDYVNNNFIKDTYIKKLGIDLDISDVITSLASVNPDLVDRIQGYYLVYGYRTDSNKTITEKGFAWKLHQVREL